MQMGSCPYPGCKGFIAIAMPDQTPAFSKTTCPDCERLIWLYHSRIDPKAYTEQSFHEEFEVNEETKHISKRSE